MRCHDCREAISARLDGELDPAEAPRVDAHLAGCFACRRFGDRVAHVTRMARTRVAEPAPDLVAAVLDAAGPPWGGRDRVRSLLRMALGGVGVAQLGLAAMDVAATVAGQGGAARLAGAGPAHLAHESAAWSLALGVGFLVVASGGRARGLVPVVAAFVGGLAALSAVDVLTGSVGPGRLVTHVVAVLGLLLLVALRRATPGDDGHVLRSPSTAPDPGPDHLPLPVDRAGSAAALPHHPAA